MKTVNWRKALTVAVVLAFGAGAQTVWDGTHNTAWFDKSPKVIKTAEDLAGLASLVANGKIAKSTVVTLGANIALNNIGETWVHGEGTEESAEETPKHNPWVAIGDFAHPFNGTFDGAGFVISGVYINKDEDEDGNYQGLFGYVDSGTIKNTRVAASYVKGGSYVGGVAGMVGPKGTIESSFSTAEVTGVDYVGGAAGYNGGTMTECYATGSIKGGDYVGGLVGFIGNTGKVKNSYATGNVSGNGYVGGLAGQSDADTIKSCYATGNVEGVENYVGGLAGSGNGHTIINSYAIGNVSGYNNIGGLVGSGSAAIKNCYAAGDVSGKDVDVGGLVGEFNVENGGTVMYGYYKGDSLPPGGGRGPGIPKTTPYMKNQQEQGRGERFVDLLNAAAYALTGNKWIYSANEYPTLSKDVMKEADFFACFAAGEATEKIPLIITARAHLENLSAHVNCGGALSGKYLKLGNEINLSVSGNQLTTVSDEWTAIGQRQADNAEDMSFKGIFDGAGYAIRNMYINKIDEIDSIKYQGLFGRIGKGGVVKNLTVTGANVNGYYHVGVLAGWNGGRIINCHADSGAVSGIGGISGGGEVGGLVGKNEGDTIRNSSADISVTGTANMVGGLVGWNCNSGTIAYSFAIGGVNGSGEDLGGLVGRNDNSKVTNCYATGNITGETTGGIGNAIGGLVGINYMGTVETSYAVGSVRGNSSLGGLIGLNLGANTKISASYYNIDGKTANSYGEPKDTNSMRQLDTYVGWDTLKVWNIDKTGKNNRGYPYIDYGSRPIMPTIETQPAGGTILTGGAHTLSVTALPKSAPLSYEWYSNTSASTVGGKKITDATDATYKLTASEAGTYYYYVVVSNTLNDAVIGEKKASVTSSVAAVTVNPVSILSPDRVIPALDAGKEETALISPVSAVAAEITAGPNSIKRLSGAVNFYRRGKRISDCELQIYDAGGNAVCRIRIEDKEASGQLRRVASWNLKDAAGRPVPPGAYLVKGTAVADGKKEKVSILVSVR